MTEIYKFFEATLARLDDMRNTIGAISQQMSNMSPRLEMVSAQIKKNIPVRDETLELDFNTMAKDFFDFSNNMEEFWTTTRDKLRQFNKKEIAEEYGLEVKTLNIKARVITRAIDEVATQFGYLYPVVKASPLKLNIWLLEAASLNLDKLASKILFMARELSKTLETKGSSRRY
ncbi:hypothetical protein AAIR98_000467 [Elusimicrobium simillimum]|uniref:hypothetical protein n=1 Tax=Elusimicrobium simillimum TaxID=3143438 RepID=UPI003C6EE50B